MELAEQVERQAPKGEAASLAASFVRVFRDIFPARTDEVLSPSTVSGLF